MAESSHHDESVPESHETRTQSMHARASENDATVSSAGVVGSSSSAFSLRPGERFGKYTINSVIGEGGMGVVFRAEQEKPRRTVALKLVRPDRVNDRLLKRFEIEAEVLGRLTHPYVASIYDAGIESGIPYFAMEFVEGETLITAVERRALSTAGRLELFAKICDAVHHAHQKGVIHRDLKPANILITEQEGQLTPRVMDFGVARVTDADLPTTMLETDAGQLIGTLPYMSPEQASGDPAELDTRSDVYALGVVLFELLSGTLPYDIKRQMLHEAVRVIREDDATRLSHFDTHLRGDIETIVAKALEKSKDRRYQSAAEFSADLRRYLHNEPIVARPASAMYQLSKFARRNRALVTGAGATVAALAIGAIGTTTFAFSAEAARSEAVEERRAAEALNVFIIDDLLLGSEALAGQEGITAVELIDRAIPAIGTRLKGFPSTQNRLESTVGRAYLALGDPGRARPILARVINKLRVSRDSTLNSDDLVELELALAEATWREREAAESIGVFAAAVEQIASVRGSDDPIVLRALNQLASMYKHAGDLDEAERIYGRALAGWADRGEADSREALIIESNLVLVSIVRGNRLRGSDPQAALQVYADARRTYEPILERTRTALDESDHHLMAVLSEYASLLNRLGELEDAIPVYTEVLSLMHAHLSPRHFRTLLTTANLGRLHMKRGDFEQASRVLQRAVDGYRLMNGTTDSRYTLPVTYWLAESEEQRDRPDNAEFYLRRVYEDLAGLDDVEEARLRVAAERIADFLARQDRQAEAEEWRSLSEPPA